MPLENQIRSAFGCSLPLNTFSGCEYEDWNTKIIKHDNQTVKKYLPLLLINQIYDDKNVFSSTGDHLIYFLDGNLDTRRNTKDNSYQQSKQYREETFSNFTLEESEAVLRWLKEVAYSKYEDLCMEDVQSAIRYWSLKTERKNE